MATCIGLQVPKLSCCIVTAVLDGSVGTCGTGMQAISHHEPLHGNKLRDSLPGETPWQPQQCDPGPVQERHEKGDRCNGADKSAYVQKKVLRISKSLKEIQSLRNELVSSVHEKKTAHVPLAENPFEIQPDP